MSSDRSAEDVENCATTEVGDDRRNFRGLEDLEAIAFEDCSCWDGNVRIERIEGAVAVKDGCGRWRTRGRRGGIAND